MTLSTLTAIVRRLHHHYSQPGADVSRIAIDLGQIVEGLEQMERSEESVKSAGASNPAAGSPIPPADGNPSYEQRLWDEYAGRAMESLILALKPQVDDMGYIFPSSWRPIVSGSQKLATEMLAERAKRMKGETK